MFIQFRPGGPVLLKAPGFSFDYGKYVISHDGIIKGCILLKKRFDDCHKAAEFLSKSCSILTTSVQGGGDISAECEKGCNECTTGCSESSGACYNELKSEIKKEVGKKIDETKDAIKESIGESLENIRNKISKLFNDIIDGFKNLFNSPHKDSVNDNGDDDLTEEENNINELKAIIQKAKITLPTSSEFDEIINKILEFHKNDLWGEIEKGNGNEYWEELPALYKIVVAAKLNMNKSSGITDYGFDPAYHNEMFKDVINLYIDGKSKDEIFKTLSIFSLKNKQNIYDRIKSVNPSKKAKTGLEAQRILGVRKQCKEWVDSIAKKNGGQAVLYKNAKVVLTIKNVQPGKAVYLKKPQHSAIITELKRNSEGAIIAINIAESNWANKWEDPKGDIPWDRTVKKRTIQAKEFSGWNIADID